MKTQPSLLTFDQQREIEKLADSLNVVEHAEAVAALRVRFGGESSQVPVGALNRDQRQRRLRKGFIEAAQSYVQRLTENMTRIPTLRDGTRKRLQELVSALRAILGDDGARNYLYVARDLAAGLEEGGVVEDGCLVAKTLDEGRPSPISVKGDVAAAAKWTAVVVGIYEQAKEQLSEPKPPEGAWVRDYVRELLIAAEFVLSKPPFRRDKRNDALEGLIHTCAWLVEWATGKQPTINNRPNAARRGDLFDVVEGVLEIVGARCHTDVALAQAIGRTLKKYPPRGLFASS